MSQADIDADDAAARDFDWRSETVIQEQPATAVYENTRGQVVIRQRDTHRDWDSRDEDGYVFFNLEALAGC
jgi:hypothetical protein